MLGRPLVRIATTVGFICAAVEIGTVYFGEPKVTHHIIAVSQRIASAQPNLATAPARYILKPEAAPVLPSEPAWQQRNVVAAPPIKRENQSPDSGYERSDGVNSIDDLVAQIENIDMEDIDLDEVVDFVNSSADAFEYISSTYLLTEDEELKRVLLNILDNCNHPEKTDLALDLVSSVDLSERKKAYAWLSRSEDSDTTRFSDVFVDAIRYEQDSELLVNLISTMTFPDRDSANYAYDNAVSRMNELAFHEDENVSGHAISTIAQVAPTKETLGILLTHLENSSENLQLAAINGLSHFDYPGEDVMSSLNTLIENPSAPQQLRAATVRLVVAFENHVTPPEDAS